MFRRSRRPVSEGRGLADLFGQAPPVVDGAEVPEDAIDEPLPVHADEPLPSEGPLQAETPIEVNEESTAAEQWRPSVTAAPVMAVAPSPLTATSGGMTTIGPAAVIDGTIRTSDDLRVDGSVTGALEIGGDLEIERGGSVSATVLARSVRVRGRLQGEVTCVERLEVMQDGHAEGKFSTAILVIEEGALVSGRFSMKPQADRIEEADDR